MNTFSLITMLLSAVSIGLCLFILARIKHVVYLLEQPVVKKMGPELKLKTVKVEDADDHRKHNHRAPQGQNSAAPTGRPPQGPRNEGPRNDGPRPEGQRDRNPRPEGQQGQRHERGGNDHRGPDRNRDRDRDRGPRQDRGERGERNDRGERGERGERPERQRPRLDVFNNERDAAPAPVDSAPRNEAPVSTNVERPALAPRRPLAANVEREEGHTPSTPASAPSDMPADAIFVGDDGDMQHGRRTQLKKKPRFNIDEEEVKTEETKVQA